MGPDVRILAGAMVALVMSAGPAASEPFRQAKDFNLAAGDALELRTELGSVAVHGVEGRRATVVVSSDRADVARRFDIRMNQVPGKLQVIVERRDKGFFSWFSSFRGSARITVEVPRATPVDVRSSGGGIELTTLAAAVRASSSGGGVKVTDVRGDVTVSSSGGGVDAQQVRGALHLNSSGGGVTARDVQGPVVADTSGGSLRVERATGDVTASSSGGGVEVTEAGGRVKAGSSGGPVNVSFAAGNGQGGEISSSGGGVEVTLDPAVKLTVDAESSGGPVRSDVPVTVQGATARDKLHGRLNGGGALLRLRSSGGGIAIESR